MVRGESITSGKQPEHYSLPHQVADAAIAFNSTASWDMCTRAWTRSSQVRIIDNNMGWLSSNNSWCQAWAVCWDVSQSKLWIALLLLPSALSHTKISVAVGLLPNVVIMLAYSPSYFRAALFTGAVQSSCIWNLAGAKRGRYFWTAHGPHYEPCLGSHSMHYHMPVYQPQHKWKHSHQSASALVLVLQWWIQGHASA